MNASNDLLYRIFENYLFSALVENETTDEFIAVVVRDYIGRLSERGAIPLEHVAGIELDLRDEVLEMLRKKTYGHYSLAEFRKAHLDKAHSGGGANYQLSEAQSRRARKNS